MNGLNEQFSDQVDFVYIDIDESGSAEIMEQLDVRRRSTYVLLGPDGSELTRWSGPLNQASVTEQLTNALAEISQ